MKELTRVFESSEFGKVRIIFKKGQPWFVAKDVCDILGLENNRDALSALDKDEKSSVKITDESLLTNTVGNSDSIPKRGNPNMSVVSESGLYALIFRSRKENAKAFRKWVTSEVLPAIRETGKYEQKTEWQKIRDDGKSARRQMTDKIKEMIEHMEFTGKKIYGNPYATISKIINDALGVIPVKGKTTRDDLSSEELAAMQMIEFILRDVISKNIDDNSEYTETIHEIENKVCEIAKFITTNCKLKITNIIELEPKE